MVKRHFPAYFRGQRVLEVGSLNINGTVRVHFEACAYTGIDVGPGPGVDVVCQGQDYDAADGSFDVVVSCETMEHNPFWRETLANMARLCRAGGLLIMTCASTGRPEHGTKRTTPADAPLIPWDYYRNLSPAELCAAMRPDDAFIAWTTCVDTSSRDLYFVGFKLGGAGAANAATALASIRRYYLAKSGVVACRRAAKIVAKAALTRALGQRGYQGIRALWVGAVPGRVEQETTEEAGTGSGSDGAR